MHSEMELISIASYSAGLRKTMWGNDFTAFLPLYINEEHFQRAKKHIPKALAALCPHRRSPVFNPCIVLDVLPRLMNTMVVLLCDDATPAHDLQRWLRGYCMVHRLFIAMVQTYPVLREEIRRLLQKFLHDERARTKDVCPSLGELIPLLTVCDSVGWEELGPVIISESNDRNILWICRDVPQLRTHFTYVRTADAKLLQDVLVASRLSKRLVVFHCCFLQLFCSPRGARLQSTASAYDKLLGFPSLEVEVRLARMLQSAKEVSNWRALYAALFLPCPSPVQLCNILADSVKASLRKGYHSKTTDFSRIQSRGVSNILLRGKSYPRCCFVIDVSGSMSATFHDDQYGEISRLERVKLYLKDALTNHLTTRDQFNIIFFESRVHTWSEGMVQATQPNVKSALTFIARQDVAGATNMNDALKFAYSLPQVAAVYLLSDGEPNVNFEGNEHLCKSVRRWSQGGKIPCHCTAFFASDWAKALMREISDITGGVFVEHGTE
jgi:hypothetical protein